MQSTSFPKLPTTLSSLILSGSRSRAGWRIAVAALVCCVWILLLGLTAQAAAPTADFGLTASPSAVNPGAGITVTWTAPDGRPANDWIGLYKVGDPEMGYSAWQYTAGASSGSAIFTAPSQTGQYEFRYFTNNSYNRAATSNTVTVGGGEVTFSLNAGPSTVNPGAAITVTWTAPDGRPANDWIGLYKVGDPDTGYSAWHYTAGAPSGSITFTAPTQTGPYEFRYFTNNSYTKVATSNPVTVGNGGWGNYPDTSVLLSSDTAVAPDAAPASATSINVSTSSSFKGKLEGNPATGVVRVTNAHPAGTYTVTVKAFDSGGAPTTKTFKLTVTTPVTCVPVSFAPAVSFAVGDHPESIAVGDFNGDGKQDVVVANYISNSVSILLGDGGGSFGTATNFSVGVFPSSVAVADFNGDGKQDLAVANANSHNVSILLGDGTGSFGTATNFGVDTYPTSLAVGDFNGDGKQDLAVAINESLPPDNVSILLGDGAGSFSAATNFGVGDHFGSTPKEVAVGDFNADGKQDLAVVVDYLTSSYVSILFGDGAGSFSGPQNFNVGASPGSVTVGDFNGDGIQDLAVGGDSQYSAQYVTVLLGDGVYFGRANIDVGSFPNSIIAVGDFNGDGQQDLAVVNYNLSIMLAGGYFIFSPPINFYNHVAGQSAAVGDFDGDGLQDLAVGGGTTVSILLRNCAATPTPTPTPTPAAGYGLTAGPSTLNPGQAITVTWTAPDGRPANDWLGLYKVGDPDQGYSAWHYTAGAPSGSVTFTAPSQEGQYEFRYFTNNSYNKVATSNLLTVGNVGGWNYPDRSVSLSTDTTVTPDAAPANATSINASTSSDFKGTLEGNPATGVVRVTNAHPAGTYTVTVTAFDSGGASTTKTFGLTVTTPATCVPVSFAAAIDFGVGGTPSSVAVGDFNGDGKQDLAANDGSILLGDGAGGFTATGSGFGGGGPIAVGDFNGDGKQDLAVANYGSNSVSIFLGDGAGGFSAATNFGVGAGPRSIAMGDFNGDGKQDLATANDISDSVSILLGNGAGGFTGRGFELEGLGFFFPSSVVVFEFDGNGTQDLAVLMVSQNLGGHSHVTILTGDGAGSFSRQATVFNVDGFDNFPNSVAVGDFNGDGQQDLAVANWSSGNVSILLGEGGEFRSATNFAVGAGRRSVAIGDFNGDGKQDLAVGGFGGSYILLGDGKGSFGAPTNSFLGSSSVAVGDFNGDGMQDLAVTKDFPSNNVSILLRDCATPTPGYALTASPSTVNPGEAITVTWTALDGRPANDWIGLCKVGDPDKGYVAWQYTAGAPSGSTTFTAPNQTGQYEFRYFTNNSYIKVATSNAVTVGGSP